MNMEIVIYSAKKRKKKEKEKKKKHLWELQTQMSQMQAVSSRPKVKYWFFCLL